MIKVLVAEDNSSERDLISNYLREDGYNVVNAKDGKEALNKISEEKPDVVLTDLVMPEMNGLELCRSLKKNPVTHNLPIVVCTVRNSDIDRLWVMRQGVDVYLVKPFTQKEILRAVKSVVS
ncbi:MAG: PleD family two-component system response regulator [Xenococcaceae cyanobacterium]